MEKMQGDSMQKNSEVFLSVIIPIYRVEKYLHKCIDSVIEQSYKDIELILVDDGSDDSCPQICDDYATKDGRIKVIHKENGGLSSARNAGMMIAKGKYIWFVDADDLICGNIKEELVPMLNQYQPDIIAFDAEAFNETNETWNLNYYDRKSKIKDFEMMSGKDFFKMYYMLDAYRDSACLNIYKKAFLDRNNIRFPSGEICEDIAFTFEVYMTAETVKYVPHNYYKRRYRNQSITTSGNDEKKINGFFHVLQWNTKIIKSINTDEKLRYVFRQYLFNYLSVQMDRIEHSDLRDKGTYFVTAFDMFFQECGCLTDLSGINMLLTYMSILEKRIDCKELKSKTFEFENGVYSWEELKEQAAALHKSLVTEILRSLPFDKEISVGVYGIGEHTKKLLKSYREYMGQIRANLVFLDSNAQSNTITYEDKPVYNIRDVCDKELEAVVISSCRYQEELYHTISEMKVDSNIIKLYTKAEDTFDFFI